MWSDLFQLVYKRKKLPLQVANTFATIKAKILFSFFDGYDEFPESLYMER